MGHLHTLRSHSITASCFTLWRTSTARSRQASPNRQQATAPHQYSPQQAGARCSLVTEAVPFAHDPHSHTRSLPGRQSLLMDVAETIQRGSQAVNAAKGVVCRSARWSSPAVETAAIHMPQPEPAPSAVPQAGAMATTSPAHSHSNSHTPQLFPELQPGSVAVHQGRSRSAAAPSASSWSMAGPAASAFSMSSASTATIPPFHSQAGRSLQANSTLQQPNPMHPQRPPSPASQPPPHSSPRMVVHVPVSMAGAGAKRADSAPGSGAVSRGPGSRRASRKQSVASDSSLLGVLPELEAELEALLYPEGKAQPAPARRASSMTTNPRPSAGSILGRAPPSAQPTQPSPPPPPPPKQPQPQLPVRTTGGHHSGMPGSPLGLLLGQAGAGGSMSGPGMSLVNRHRQSTGVGVARRSTSSASSKDQYDHRQM